MCEYVCLCSSEDNGQEFFLTLPSTGFQKFNWGHQPCQEVPLATELSCWPKFHVFKYTSPQLTLLKQNSFLLVIAPLIYICSQREVYWSVDDYCKQELKSDQFLYMFI